MVDSESFQEGDRYISNIKKGKRDVENRLGGGFETRERSAVI